MASYCTDYYTSQRDNQEQNHGPNQQSRIGFARASSADARRTERQLVNLEPPAELATAFDQFLDITHRISEDRATMLASIRAVGQDGWAGDDVEVVEVTGVEELTATVSYLKVGGCYCTLDGTLRLFFLDGQWRVNQSADLDSSQLIPVDN